jgi:hypothetical protein
MSNQWQSLEHNANAPRYTMTFIADSWKESGVTPSISNHLSMDVVDARHQILTFFPFSGMERECSLRPEREVDGPHYDYSLPPTVEPPPFSHSLLFSPDY